MFLPRPTPSTFRNFAGLRDVHAFCVTMIVNLSKFADTVFTVTDFNEIMKKNFQGADTILGVIDKNARVAHGLVSIYSRYRREES